MLARRHKLIQRCLIGVAVLGCLYLGAVLVLPSLLQHIFGIGTYDKRTGVYSK